MLPNCIGVLGVLLNCVGVLGVLFNCVAVLLNCVGVLQVERLMDMLRRREYETTSVISEEDSTTDSGRGASEEGDHGHLNSG